MAIMQARQNCLASGCSGDSPRGLCPEHRWDLAKWGRGVGPQIQPYSWHTGQLILRKISKFYAIICQILRLKCTKFDFRWGSAPDPAREAYSAPQAPYMYLRGLLLRGGRGRGREGKGRGRASPPTYFGLESPRIFD